VAAGRLLQCEWSYPVAKVFIRRSELGQDLPKDIRSSDVHIKSWLAFLCIPCGKQQAQQTILCLLHSLVDLEDGGSMFLRNVGKLPPHITYSSVGFVVYNLIFEIYMFFLSRGRVVGIATGYRLDNRRVGIPVPVGSRILSSSHRPSRLWGLPSLLSNGYRRLFPRG
jgi:hypothetical protein